MSLQYALPGHNHVPEYQASGVPWVSSSHAIVNTTAVEFVFPYVSRHFTIFNSGTTEVRVGFTQNGVDSNPNANYFLVLANSQSPRFEIKTDKVFVRKESGTDPSTVSIVAGLTGVDRSRFFHVTGSQGVTGVG